MAYTAHFGLSGGAVTTEEALLTNLGPTGSFCLALLANVLPTTPGDLDRWWDVELESRICRDHTFVFLKIQLLYSTLVC